MLKNLVILSMNMTQGRGAGCYQSVIVWPLYIDDSNRSAVYSLPSLYGGSTVAVSQIFWCNFSRYFLNSTLCFASWLAVYLVNQSKSISSMTCLLYRMIDAYLRKKTVKEAAALLACLLWGSVSFVCFFLVFVLLFFFIYNFCVRVMFSCLSSCSVPSHRHTTFQFQLTQLLLLVLITLSAGPEL